MNKINKIEELVSRIVDAFNTCVDNVRIHGGYEMWEDWDMIALPAELTPDEKMELIEKLNSNVTHYCYWTDLPNIIKEGENAKSIMVYVDDTSSWWRFEA